MFEMAINEDKAPLLLTPGVNADDGTIQDGYSRSCKCCFISMLVTLGITLVAAGTIIAMPLEEKINGVQSYNVPIHNRDTICIPIRPDSKHILSLKLNYDKDNRDGSVVVLPCSDLSEPSHEVNVSGSSQWVYLVNRSVIYFTYDRNQSDYQNFSVWILDDYLKFKNFQPETCDEEGEDNGICYPVSASSPTSSHLVTSTSYYFIVTEPPAALYAISLKFDRYSYNFTNYTLDARTYSLTDKQPVTIPVNSIFLQSFTDRPEKCILLKDNTHISTSTHSNVSVSAKSTFEVSFIYILGFGLLFLICAITVIVTVVVCVKKYRRARRMPRPDHPGPV